MKLLGSFSKQGLVRRRRRECHQTKGLMSKTIAVHVRLCRSLQIKGHVTRGNFSCNLQRNDDEKQTFEVAEGDLTRKQFVSQRCEK